MPQRPGPRKWRIDLPAHEALEGLSEAQRLEVIERLNVRLHQHPAVRTMMVVVVMLSMTAGIMLSDPLAAWLQTLGLGRVVAHIIGAMSASLGAVIVGYAVGYRLLWRHWSRAFRNAMREIGRDVCLECGYWLRGLDDAVTHCPECGAERSEALEPTPQGSGLIGATPGVGLAAPESKGPLSPKG